MPITAGTFPWTALGQAHGPAEKVPPRQARGDPLLVHQKERKQMFTYSLMDVKPERREFPGREGRKRAIRGPFRVAGPLGGGEGRPRLDFSREFGRIVQNTIFRRKVLLKEPLWESLSTRVT
jgi:hypothetical protein